MIKKNKTGFSLIELSMVLLVIAIIVVAIMLGGNKLKNQARIAAAQALTKSSPVKDIPNLELWLETTLAKSFIQSEVYGGGVISTWYDINQQSSSQNNATQVTVGSRATYVSNAIKGLPVLRFDGATSYYTYNSIPMNNTNYTIFVVEQRRSSASTNYFIAGSIGVSNARLHLGYRTNTSLTHAQFGNDYNMTIPAYSSPTPTVRTFIHSNAYGKKCYSNGSLLGSSADTTPLSGYNDGTIGNYSSTNYYNGDIGEIIMFSRDLTDLERQDVESYLIKKWKIS